MNRRRNVMKLHHLVPALGALMLAVICAAGPAQAAGGRQLQTFTCAGEPVTIAVSPGNEGDNWGAARVVDGGTLIPVSIEYLVRDDTAAITLDDEIVSHGGPAHAQQETITCSVSETAVLGDVAPPDLELPPGVSSTDHVTMSMVVRAVPRP
jgi:hypothetical protein